MGALERLRLPFSRIMAIFLHGSHSIGVYCRGRELRMAEPAEPLEDTINAPPREGNLARRPRPIPRRHRYRVAL
jgi:hypothetical protein